METMHHVAKANGIDGVQSRKLRSMFVGSHGNFLSMWAVAVTRVHVGDRSCSIEYRRLVGDEREYRVLFGLLLNVAPEIGVAIALQLPFPLTRLERGTDTESTEVIDIGSQLLRETLNGVVGRIMRGDGFLQPVDSAQIVQEKMIQYQRLEFRTMLLRHCP